MAGKMVALTDIHHGMEDGNVKTFRRGDAVTGLSKETMLALVEAGSVGEEEQLPERREAPGEPSDMEKEFQVKIEERDSQIAELRTKLAAAEAKLNPPQQQKK
jgi:hypothetical protein